MTIRTCAVTFQVFRDDGTPDANAVVEARLNRYDVVTGEGFVLPYSVSVKADADGKGTLNLVPNALGSTHSSYNTVIQGTDKTVKMTTVVPDADTATLEACSTLPEYPGKPEGQIAVEEAVAAAGQAQTSASEAQASATAAGTSEANAAASEQAAATSAGNAQQSAADSADSASTALTYKQNALQSSSDAAAAQIAAQNARDAAQASATSASSSKDAAAASATDAANSAASTAALYGDATALNTAVADAQQSATDAADSANTAQVYKQNALQSSSDAAAAQLAAESARDDAQASATAAASSATSASDSKTAAQASATAASNSQTAAASSADAASTSAATANSAKSAAQVAQSQAEAASSSAEASKDSSLTAQAAAEAARDTAVSAKTAAQASQTAAASSETSASNSADQASSAAASANTSAAAASSTLSNALALYGGAAALDGAVSEAEGFALTATAQASLASTYALQAASVAQQDLSGAISQALHRSPNAVVAQCIDDPRLWSDGGAVLERLSGLSYQRETLNGAWLGWVADEAAARAITGSTTGDYFGKTGDGKFYRLSAGTGTTETFRGNKANYGRAAWIAEAARVPGYAVDEIGCPLWKVLTAGANNAVRGTSISSVQAGNGWLLVGTNTGLTLIDFAKDCAINWGTAGRSRYLGNLAQCNDGKGWAVEDASKTIASNTVNAVAATVMPDAPCDPVTGLQVPTIACFTAGGIPVIQNNGIVVSSAATVSFSGGCITPYALTAFIGSNASFYLALNPGKLGAAFNLPTFAAGSLPDFMQGNTGRQVLSGRAFVARSSGAKVQGLRLNEGNPAASLAFTITDTYSTGYSVAAMRMYLASVSAGVVSGANKVTNGDFSAGTAGWTVGANATVDTSSGSAVITATNVTDRVLQQAITVTPNVPNTITFRASVSAGNSSRVRVSNSNSLSTPAVDYFDNIPTTVPTDYRYTFTPTQATVYLAVLPTTDGVTTTTVDNFAVADAVADRSYKGAALQVHGTVTKTAVAAGAQLVAYSGFSNTNYLQEAAPSADLDPATGALHETVWGTIPTNVSAAGWAVDRSAATGAFYRLGCDATGKIVASISDGTTTRTVTSPAAYNTGVRVKMGFAYTTDGTLTLNVNSLPVATATGTPLASLSNAAAVLTVGNSFSLNAAWPGDLALLDIGMTAPTAEQSAYEYAQELAMFQPGAQVTLPDSGSVVDMDYDSAIDGLRVASAANESRFCGLQRVSSTPVSAGSIAKIAGRSGIKLIARTGTNAGVDISIPPKNLLEELNKRAQDAARIATKKFVWNTLCGFNANTTAGSGQLTNVTNFTAPPMGATIVGAKVKDISGNDYTIASVDASGKPLSVTPPVAGVNTNMQFMFYDYILPVGWEAEAAYKAGLMKEDGSTKDYTKLFDGFRERVRFASAVSNGDFIAIEARKVAR